MAKGTYHKRPAPVGAGFTLTNGGASVNSVMSSDYGFIHVYASADCHIAFGKTAPTAVADHTCLKIKAETPYIFPIDPGHYMASIAAAGTVEVHYME